MTSSPTIPPSEHGSGALTDPARLAALHRSRLLDTAPEEAFDRFSRLAVRLLGVPTALVSLVDFDRQFFKSCVGLREPYATDRQTPLSHSFCQYTVMERSPLVVRDARSDPLVSDNRAIEDLGVVAYAGVPLVTQDGHVLGSFCAIDGKPRDWSDDDLATLRDLAGGVMTEIELREANAEAGRLVAAMERHQVEVASLLDSTAEGIYGIDRQGRCSFLNASATRLLGYRSEEILGRNMHALIHHTQADGSPYPEAECPISRAVTRGEGIRLPKEVLWRRDGSSFLAECSAQPVLQAGEVSGAVITFLDVTARHEAEQRLKVQHAVASILAASNDREQALPGLLATIGSGLGWDVGLLWLADGDVLVCDQAWQSPSGDAGDFIEASRQARVGPGHGLVGSVWSTGEPVWVADLQRERRFDRIRAARREGIGGALAFPVQSGGQVLGVVELLSHSQRQPDADLLRTLSVLGYQIGQFMSRLEAEDWLRIANRAIAAASTGITISDVHGDMPILYVNPAFSSTTGYAPDEVIGRNCRFLQGPATDPAEVAQLRTAIAKRTSCCSVLLNYRKDGTPFWNDLTLSPVTDPTGTVTHYIGIQADVTARKQIEHELEEARQSSEAASQAKSRFLASMSHELRTPLNAVILYSELLQDEAEDRGVPEFIPDLGKIRAAGQHLLSLINTVLDLAKVESGKTELHLESFDVAEVIQEVVATAAALVEKNGNVLELNVADDLGVMRADVVKLRQILFNFLSNAAKFTADGRVVLIALREDSGAGGSIVLRVRDTGIGMSEEQLARLFQPFTQADESITRKYGGTGLGLALCAELAKLMGGTLEITSEPGVGTEITARLPVDGGAAPVDSPGVLNLPMEGCALVIDDDPASREELLSALADQGIPAAAAVDGLDGLRMARSLRPGIIFLDVIMPVLDGWEVLAALKADPELATVPVVMVTLSPTEDLGYLLGAADYLMKPLDRERLLEVLSRFGTQHEPRVVLVVDDDAGTRTAVRKLLEREGWSVEEAEHGQAGLEQLAATPVSLVILDLIMPEMDGFEFLARLRREAAWRNLPVVVMTSKDLTRDDRARLAGTVHSIIEKGVHTREDVLRQVREIALRSVLRPAAHPSSGQPAYNEE